VSHDFYMMQIGWRKCKLIQPLLHLCNVV